MNVVLVKLSSLGDVVHALPVAATLAARRPGARVTWLVERRVLGHDSLPGTLHDAVRAAEARAIAAVEAGATDTDRIRAIVGAARIIGP